MVSNHTYNTKCRCKSSITDVNESNVNMLVELVSTRSPLLDHSGKTVVVELA
jgi:hypothetical protein